MASKALPPRPDLEQYKKQAKELAKKQRIKLADAQFRIAREHGFESWPKFAKHIRSITEPVFRRAEKAVVAGDVETLDALLREHEQPLRTGRPESTWSGGLAPDFSNGDARSIIAREHHFDGWEDFAAHEPVPHFERAVDAVVNGDAPKLRALLRAHPGLVHARSKRKHHATLLHYVGANGVEGFRQRTPKNAVEVASILLDCGAEINAVAGMYGGSRTFDLVATSIHPVLAGVQEELMELLLSRGAIVDPGLINSCHANGRPSAAEFLAARVQAMDLEAAAGVGRLDVVKTFVDEDGNLKNGATKKQANDGFNWACEYGRIDVVDFLLHKGIVGDLGLHWAAYRGDAAIVKLLLEHQVPVNGKDSHFDKTPLGWALYAWNGGGPRPGHDDYRDVATLLLNAGATVDDEEDARRLAALGAGG